MRARLRRSARIAVDRLLARRNYGVVPLDQIFDAQNNALHDLGAPLPEGAAGELRLDSPRLAELRTAYRQLGWPVGGDTRWMSEALNSWLDLRYFRGDNAYIWHYRETLQVSRLKYFVFLRYVQGRDTRSLIEKLGEDGLFGCWTYRFPGEPPCSRDLLDSVNELSFLDRHLDLFARRRLRVLDIGAGYGRLAHRTAQALPDLADYCCVDAVAESTFLCEYYTRFRGVTPPVRVVPLPGVPQLSDGEFDLVVNVHSFSECALASIDWWAAQLSRLHVPHLFLVPNEPSGFLSTEADGSRQDYRPAIEAAGYRLVADEPAYDDPALRDLLDVHDRFCLFELAR